MQAVPRGPSAPEERLGGETSVAAEAAAPAGPAAAQTRSASLRIGEVVFEGFDDLPPWVLEALRHALGRAARQSRRLDELQQAAGELALRALREHGYPHRTVTATTSPGAMAGAIRLILRATPGSTGYFGPVTIAGHRSIDDGVIRRYVAYRPGERFRGSLVEETARRLSAIELFERVEVQLVGAAGQPAVATLATVTEGKPQRLAFNGGFGTEEKLVGEALWRHRNLFGRADSAGLLGRWSALERGVQGDLRRPYLGSPLWSLEVAARRWRIEERTFARDTLGGSFRVSRRSVARDALGRVRAHTAFSIALAEEAEEVGVRTAGEAAASVPGGEADPRVAPAAGWRSTLAVTWQRRIAFDAGSLAPAAAMAMQLEQAGWWLGGAFRYVELAVETDGRLPAGRRYAIEGRVRAAILAGPSAPLFKRYFLGGATSLRGWGRFEITPRDAQGRPIGGQTRFDMTTEWHAAVARRVTFVLFLDAGNTWADPWRVALGDLRAAAGVGGRVLTPVGLVRIDVGYQLTPLPVLTSEGRLERRRWRVHVAVGR